MIISSLGFAGLFCGCFEKPAGSVVVGVEVFKVSNLICTLLVYLLHFITHLVNFSFFCCFSCFCVVCLVNSYMLVYAVLCDRFV